MHHLTNAHTDRLVFSTHKITRQTKIFCAQPVLLGTLHDKITMHLSSTLFCSVLHVHLHSPPNHPPTQQLQGSLAGQLPQFNARSSWTYPSSAFYSEDAADGGGDLRHHVLPSFVPYAPTLRASLSGTFLQTLPDLVMPLKGLSLSPRSRPPTQSVPSERFGY